MAFRLCDCSWLPRKRMKLTSLYCISSSRFIFPLPYAVPSLFCTARWSWLTLGRGRLEMPLDCIAMGFFSFPTLEMHSSLWREGPDVDEISQEPAGRWTRTTLQGSDPGHVGPTRRRGRVGGVFGDTLSTAGRLWEAPDGWDARLLLRPCVPGPRCRPATSVADGKQMFRFAGRKHPETGNRGLRRPFSSVPPQTPIEEGKLHLSNDPARGLNYNRLKPIPCFKDLCNLKRKKKVMRFKVRYSQLDGFRNFFFHVKFYYCCFCNISLPLSPHVNSCCHSDALASFSPNLLSHLLFPTTGHPISCC